MNDIFVFGPKCYWLIFSVIMCLKENIEENIKEYYDFKDYFLQLIISFITFSFHSTDLFSHNLSFNKICYVCY